MRLEKEIEDITRTRTDVLTQSILNVLKISTNNTAVTVPHVIPSLPPPPPPPPPPARIRAPQLPRNANNVNENDTPLSFMEELKATVSKRELII